MTDEIPAHVVADVNYTLEAMIGLLEPDLFAKPKIQASTTNTSYFQPNTNVIGIHKNHYDDGIIYFEEASHAIRAHLVHPRDDIGMLVQEFFGRLGEEIGRKLIAGTTYERLFEGHPPRNFSDDSLYEREVRNFLSSSSSFGTIIRTMEAVDNAKLMNRAFHQAGIEMAKIVVDYAVEEAPQVIRDKYQSAWNLIIQRTKEIENDIFPKDFLDFNKSYCDIISRIGEQAVTLSKYTKEFQHTEDEDIRGKLQSSIQVYLQTIKQLVVKLVESTRIYQKESRTDEDMQEVYLNMLLLEFADYELHAIGYVAAEEYIASGADFMSEAPDLFRRPDQEIYDRFVSEHRQQLYTDIKRRVFFEQFPEAKKYLEE